MMGISTHPVTMELRTAKSQKPRLRTAITNATTLGITSPGLSSPSLYSLGFLVVKICHRHVVCTDYLAHGIKRLFVIRSQNITSNESHLHLAAADRAWGPQAR
ncbi:hypothetical protein AX14_013870 [Amanita brunnescens Koide BX004]|nr:hypothetical protein AX14_013870 [Amanita brunnescens Koide BX004]